MKFEDHVYCDDCYDDELHEVAHKRLEEINRLLPILAAKDAEIKRLRTALEISAATAALRMAEEQGK